MIFSLNSIDWWRKLIVFGLLSLIAACEDQAPGLVTLKGPTMGTTYSIKVVGAELDRDALQRRVDQQLAAINATFSTYLDDSELSLINRSPRQQLSVSETMVFLLTMSQQIFELSGGAFDVTVGPLVNLWGFGPTGPMNGIPSEAELQVALSQTGFGRVGVDGRQLQRPASIYLDFSAIAKGYAVDEIARLLESSGAGDYLIEIGGEVKAKGRNSRGTGWVIGIEAPDRTTRRLYRTLPIIDLALATSGDYRNFFEHEGKVYSHTIDPRTGWPVDHPLASVTVLHESAAMADALATAFSVLGPDETMRLADEENLMVFAIIRGKDGFEERRSESLARYLENQ